MRGVSTGDGSIPACAGEPPDDGRRRRRRVYPRVCGGTQLPAWLNRNRPVGAGLSPRVRGNPRPRYTLAARCMRSEGLSPRVRGNHHAAKHPAGRGRVYPRVCGGTDLSGRVYPRVVTGSGQRVYPRVCGGTGVAWRTLDQRAGLSPRVRGNLSPRVRGNLTPGLSPRVRGKIRDSTLPDVVAVYPRVCGGNLRVRRRRRPAGGLSPRVRGNLDTARRNPSCGGLSPRVRGNHQPWPACHGAGRGLSPRVRGNPSRRQPASGHWVYPRVCGGTPSASQRQ